MSPHHLATAAAALLASATVCALPVHNWAEVTAAPAQINTVVPDGPADAMNGARVTVSFSDGSSDTALFVGRDAGPNFLSVAQTPAFALVAQSSGSTASFPSFTISNTDGARTLVGFQIDGRGDGNGSAAFDRGFVGSTRPSTAGSSTGVDLSLDFRDRSFLTGSVDVTYSRPLGLAGAAPVGDLFGTVAVQMQLSRVLGLPPNSNLSFINFSTDVDAVQYAAVPEPGTWALMAAGVGLLAWRRRR
jgi:hypothetical protein